MDLGRPGQIAWNSKLNGTLLPAWGMTYQRQTIWKEKREEQTPVRGRDGVPYSPQRERPQYHLFSHLLLSVFPFLDTMWLGCSFSLRDNVPSLHLHFFFLDVLSRGLFLQPHDPWLFGPDRRSALTALSPDPGSVSSCWPHWSNPVLAALHMSLAWKGDRLAPRTKMLSDHLAKPSWPVRSFSSLRYDHSSFLCYLHPFHEAVCWTQPFAQGVLN